MTTKLTASNLSAETLAAISGPRISNVKITDSSYNLIDDTAANISGGFIIINGQNFISNCQVLIDNTPATTVTFVSNSVIRAQVPASAEGTTKSIYVVNPDGSSAIIINGLTYSAFPAWSTGSTLTSFEALVPVSIQLSAPSATVYTLAAANTLPSSLSLYANGLIAGTVAANTTTNYNFTVNAKDAENQDTNRNFTLPITQNIEPAWVTAADLGSVGVSANYSNTLVATDLSNVTYSVAAGSSLPSSLTLTANGLLSGNVSAANTYSFGIVATDTANLSNTRTFSITIAVLADTFFKNTTLLLNGETTVTPFISDASTNSFPLTINGDTKPVLFNPYQEGYYSNYFDGTGDYLSAGSNSSFAVGTGDFTFQVWVYPTAYTSPVAAIFDTGSAVASGRFSVILYSSGLVYVDSNANLLISSSTLPLNAWTLISIIRSSGTMTMYFNGTSVASGSIANNFTETQSYIGRTVDGYYFQGYISNLRLVKGTALANTVPTTPLTAIANTSLLTCQSNRLIDNSTNAFTITKNGDTLVSPNIPFTQNSSYSTYGSGYFDGTGDYLTAPANAAWNFTGDWTWECWVYPTAITGFHTFLGQWGAPDNKFIWKMNSSGRMYLENLSTALTATSTTIVANQWQHIALTRSSNTIRMFVNGVLDATTATRSGTYYSSGAMRIGASGVNENFTGYMSGMRIINGTALYTTTFTPPTAPLTAIANTQLLTCQYNGGATNQGIIDNSNFNNIITRNGNVSQGTFSPYSQTGWSNYFNGVEGTYLITPVNTAFNIGAGNFTVEGWYYFNSLSIQTQEIFTFSGATTFNFTMFVWDNGNIYFRSAETSGEIVSPFASGMSVGVWYHWAVTRVGNLYTIYKNGISVASATSTAIVNENKSFSVGKKLSGYVSDVRIIKGTALYTTAFTPPSTPLTAIANTSLLTCQSNRFIDNSTNSFTITKSGDTSVQAFSPFAPAVSYTPSLHGGSAYFDGTGDWLQGVASAQNTFNMNFTIELWVYANSLSGQMGMFCVNNASTSGSDGIAIYFETGNRMSFWVRGSGGATITTTTYTTGVWYHVALVRNGSTNTLYVDGVSRATNTDTPTSSYSPIIGVGRLYNDNSSYSLNGYLSDIRVTKGTAIYTSNFVPPTQTLTNYSTTYPASLLLNMNNGGIIDQHGTNVLETVGNAQLSTAVKKYNNASMYFDGTGDYLTLPYNKNIDISTGDFTIESWVYATTTTNSVDSVWGYGNNGGMLYHAGTTWSWEVGAPNGVTNHFTLTGTASLNAWHHIACTRYGSTFTLWIDGVSASTNTTASDAGSPRQLYIGWNNSNSGNQVFTGYIDDFRITKGYARYTTTFTPPTEALIAR